jgi:tRNA threonylcarbamoyladenosine biosynthesis protein TsaE
MSPEPENDPVGSWIVPGEEEMIQLGSKLAETLLPSGCMLLVGDLGSGKTTFTKGVARVLGIAADEVHSPTYTLIHEHQGPEGDLVHADLYRLEPDAVEATGLRELLGGPGLKIVEWAERIPWREPGALLLEFEVLPHGARRVVSSWCPDAGEAASPVKSTTDGGCDER